MIDQIIQDIELHGWSYQENLLSPEVIKILQPHYETDFMPAQVGSQGARKRVEEIRGDWTRWIDLQHPLAELVHEISFLDQLQLKLNQRFFFGLKEYECHLAKYPVGSFYKRHLDRFEKDSSRVVSFVFYLNESWTRSDGGELVLYQKDGSVVGKIHPLPGSFICFLSEEFPHEVMITQKERRSLTGWMHNKLIY